MMLTNKQVVSRFVDGKPGTNRSMLSTGTVLRSYNTAILQRQAGGRLIGNVTRYSATTSKHQSMAGVRLADIQVDGVRMNTWDLSVYNANSKG